MILISACLVGINSKYNGGNNCNEKLLNMVKKGDAIFMCPEQLGGLSTPRKPSEIKYVNGEKFVYDSEGNDITKEFENGAKEVLNLLKKLNINKAILKSRSPSCGYGKVYDGNFNNMLVNGNGILTQLLIDNGIEVISSDEYL